MLFYGANKAKFKKDHSFVKADTMAEYGLGKFS